MNNLFVIIYTTLIASANLPMADEIQNILDEYEYVEPYEYSKFDCTDHSQIVWSILVDEGYDARMLVGERDDRNHMWVGVNDGTDHWIMIETLTTRNSLGEVTTSPEFFTPFMMVNSTSNMYEIVHGDTNGLVNDSTIDLAKETLIKRK